MQGFLIPHQIFVGDEARFLYPLPEDFNSENLKNFNLKPVKQNNEMTITNISIEKRDNTYFFAVNFIAWKTGEINFPDFSEFGFNISLPAVNVSSVLKLNNIQELQPPRPPILLPGTIYMIYGYAALLLSAVIFVSLFLVLLRKKTISVFRRIFMKNENKIFYKKIKKLNKRLKKIHKAFETNKPNYIKLENIWFKDFETELKNYLLFFCRHKNENTNWNSLTHSEMLNLLKKYNPSQNIIHADFALLFKTIQIARFSGTDFLSKEIFNYQNILITKSFDLIKTCMFISQNEEKEGKKC